MSKSEDCDLLAAAIVSDSGWPKEWEISDGEGPNSYELARLLEKHLHRFAFYWEGE